MYFNLIADSEKDFNKKTNPIIANFYEDFQKYIFRHNDAIFSFRLNDKKLNDIFSDQETAQQLAVAIKNGQTMDVVKKFEKTAFSDYSFIVFYITEIALRENLPVALLQQHLEYLIPFTDDSPDEKTRLQLLFLIKHAYALKDGPAIIKLAEEIFTNFDKFAPEEQNHIIVFYYLYSPQKNSPAVIAVIESYLHKEFLLGRNIETIGSVVFFTLVLAEYYCEKHCYPKAEELLMELEATIGAINNTNTYFKEAYHLDELTDYNANHFATFYYLMTKENKPEERDQKNTKNKEIYASFVNKLSVRKLYDSYYAAKNTNNMEFAGNWIETNVKKEILSFFNNKEPRQRVAELLDKVERNHIESIYYEHACLHEVPLELNKEEKEVELNSLVAMIGLEVWNKMEVFAQENICRYLENYIIYRREFIASLNNNEHTVGLVNALQKNKLFVNQKNDLTKELIEKTCGEFLWHEDNYYPLVSFYAGLDKNNKKIVLNLLADQQDKNSQLLLYKLLLDTNSSEGIMVVQREKLINEYNVPLGLINLFNYKQQKPSLKQLSDIKIFLKEEFKFLPRSIKQIISKNKLNTAIEIYRQELLNEVTVRIEQATLQHEIMLRRVREQKSDYEIFSEFVISSEEEGLINNTELNNEIESELDILEYVSLEKMPAKGEIVIAPDVFGLGHPAGKLLSEIKHEIEKNINGDTIIQLNIIGAELSFEAIFDIASNDLKIINSPVAYDQTMEYLKFWLARMWNNCYGLGDFSLTTRQQRVAEIINTLVYPEKTKNTMQYIYNFNKERARYPFRFDSEGDDLFTSFHKVIGRENIAETGRRQEIIVLAPLEGIESKEQLTDLNDIYQLGFVHRRPWRTNVRSSERAVDNYIHFERLIKEKGFNFNVADETEYYKMELAENLREDQHLFLDRAAERWQFTPTGWRGYGDDDRELGGREFERTYVMPHFRIYKVSER